MLEKILLELLENNNGSLSVEQVYDILRDRNSREITNSIRNLIHSNEVILKEQKVFLLDNEIEYENLSEFIGKHVTVKDSDGEFVAKGILRQDRCGTFCVQSKVSVTVSPEDFILIN